MIPIIISGGSGTRLWPVSRTRLPKQFCQIFDESLFTKTIRRVLPFGPPMVITTEELHTLNEKTFRDLGEKSRAVIYEPCGRNTAPAIGTICRYLQIHKLENEIVGIFPADHLIREEKLFHEAVRNAVIQAEKGLIVTLGIKPDHPATGYGYIETLKSSLKGAHAVKAFHEKPSSEVAQSYLQKGTFYWNAGMFIFRVADMIHFYQQHQPEMWTTLQTINTDFSNLAEIYPSLESISFDYAIMEKIPPTSIACVPADMGWSDVGSWDALADIQKDLAQDNVLSVSGKNNYVFPQYNKLYAFLGLDDLIVVDTPDATLISRRGESQEVKKIVASLTERKDPRCQQHAIEYRPWGMFEVLQETPSFKSKVIEVSPGSQISYQSHRFREEHWIITQGEGEVIIDDKTIHVEKGSHIHIPQGAKHRITNKEKIPLLFVEVQLGSYFGEDDIVRFADDYSRS